MGLRKFMNSAESNINRLFSQEDFAESLQVLNQLSPQEPNPQSAKVVDPCCDISWDDAAADLERFLQHSAQSSASAKFD